MPVIDMLLEEMKKSKDYPEKSFGLKVGEDWPQFVANLLESKELRSELLCNYMVGIMSSMRLKDQIDATDKDAFDTLAKKSMVYEGPLKFLFWGIQIGKRMAEVERLSSMAER